MVQSRGIQAESIGRTELRRQGQMFGDPEAMRFCRADYQGEGAYREKELTDLHNSPILSLAIIALGMHREKLHEARQRTTIRQL